MLDLHKWRNKHIVLAYMDMYRAYSIRYNDFNIKIVGGIIMKRIISIAAALILGMALLTGCGKEQRAVEGFEVKEDILFVVVTFSKDYIDEMTQEELDDLSSEEGFKSATLNDDGSVTLKMSKSRYKELVMYIADTIDDEMYDMVDSISYPKVTAVRANDDYTKFTVTTTNTKLSANETMSVLKFYSNGEMYGAISGKEVDNIEVVFINEESGEVIRSFNSKDRK